VSPLPAVSRASKPLHQGGTQLKVYLSQGSIALLCNSGCDIMNYVIECSGDITAWLISVVVIITSQMFGILEFQILMMDTCIEASIK